MLGHGDPDSDLLEDRGHVGVHVNEALFAERGGGTEGPEGRGGAGGGGPGAGGVAPTWTFIATTKASTAVKTMSPVLCKLMPAARRAQRLVTYCAKSVGASVRCTVSKIIGTGVKFAARCADAPPVAGLAPSGGPHLVREAI